MTISLALLAPALVKAAVEGRLPPGIGIERLGDPPAQWARQFEGRSPAKLHAPHAEIEPVSDTRARNGIFSCRDKTPN